MHSLEVVPSQSFGERDKVFDNDCYRRMSYGNSLPFNRKKAPVRTAICTRRLTGGRQFPTGASTAGGSPSGATSVRGFPPLRKVALGDWRPGDPPSGLAHELQTRFVALNTLSKNLTDKLQSIHDST